MTPPDRDLFLAVDFARRVADFGAPITSPHLGDLLARTRQYRHIAHRVKRMPPAEVLGMAQALSLQYRPAEVEPPRPAPASLFDHLHDSGDNVARN